MKTANASANLSLVSGGLARHTDPSTSHIAANCVDSKGLVKNIYSAMSAFGDRGCTTDEIVAVMPNFPEDSITPRFRQMLDAGMIELTGESRPGKSGRQQLVRRVCRPPFTPVKRELRIKSYHRPKAAAWTAWLETQEGKMCRNPDTLSSSNSMFSLSGRLWIAFMAGMNAATNNEERHNAEV